MNTLTVDGATLALLKQATGLAEVRDASGAVVGFFAPVSVERARQYAQAAAQVDLVELERRKREEGRGRTTREVFEHLLTLTTDPAERAHLQKKIEGLRASDASATR